MVGAKGPSGTSSSGTVAVFVNSWRPRRAAWVVAWSSVCRRRAPTAAAAAAAARVRYLRSCCSLVLTLSSSLFWCDFVEAFSSLFVRLITRRRCTLISDVLSAYRNKERVINTKHFVHRFKGKRMTHFTNGRINSRCRKISRSNE